MNIFWFICKDVKLNSLSGWWTKTRSCLPKPCVCLSIALLNWNKKPCTTHIMLLWLFLLFGLTVCFIFYKFVTKANVAERIGTRYHKQTCRHSCRFLGFMSKMGCVCSILQDRWRLQFCSVTWQNKNSVCRVWLVWGGMCLVGRSLDKVNWLWPTCCFLVVL